MPIKRKRLESEDPYHVGRMLGLRDGYDFGRKHAVTRLVGDPPMPQFNLHVLYVKAGLGFPYPPIDEAIMEALQRLVAKVSTAEPKEKVGQLAERIRPDLLLTLNGMVLPVEEVERAKAAGVRTAVWFSDDPYYTDVTIEIAKKYDHVFTLESTCVDFYRTEAGHPRVAHLPLAMNRRLFRPRTVERDRRVDICFIGSAYWHRVEFFNHLVDYLATKNIFMSGLWWNRLKKFDKIKNSIQLNHWLTPDETNWRYNSAKIVINLHRSPEDQTYNQNSRGIPASSVNPRIFEVCGSGAFQLTDVRGDLHATYTPGVELETYSTPDELINKLEFYLHNDQERQRIALRGLARTLREHTYEHRLGRLLATVFEQSQSQEEVMHS